MLVPVGAGQDRCEPADTGGQCGQLRARDRVPGGGGLQAGPLIVLHILMSWLQGHRERSQLGEGEEPRAGQQGGEGA